MTTTLTIYQFPLDDGRTCLVGQIGPKPFGVTGHDIDQLIDQMKYVVINILTYGPVKYKFSPEDKVDLDSQDIIVNFNISYDEPSFVNI